MKSNRPANKANSICTGKRDTEGWGCSCTPDINSCHTCSIDSDGAPAQCMVCKNGKALLSGKCVTGSRCAEKGGTVTGKGNFGRVCAVTAGSVRLADGHQGAPVPIKRKPEICRGRKNDLGGECSCTKTIVGCHTCSLKADGSPNQCSKCKNAKALLGNACVSTTECESNGGSVKGKGNFGRTCEGAASGVPVNKALVCSGRKLSKTNEKCWCGTALANCHSCDWPATGKPTKCSKCKNSKVLLNGVCIDATACPSQKVRGNGKFGRVCAP